MPEIERDRRVANGVSCDVSEPQYQCAWHEVSATASPHVTNAHVWKWKHHSARAGCATRCNCANSTCGCCACSAKRDARARTPRCRRTTKRVLIGVELCRQRRGGKSRTSVRRKVLRVGKRCTVDEDLRAHSAHQTQHQQPYAGERHRVHMGAARGVYRQNKVKISGVVRHRVV